MTRNLPLFVHAKKSYRLSLCGLTPELGLAIQTSVIEKVNCPLCLCLLDMAGTVSPDLSPTISVATRGLPERSSSKD